MMTHGAEWDEVRSMQQMRPSPWCHPGTVLHPWLWVTVPLQDSQIRVSHMGCSRAQISRACEHAPSSAFISKHSLSSLITKRSKCTPGIPVWPNVRPPSIDTSVELHDQGADLLFRWQLPCPGDVDMKQRWVAVTKGYFPGQGWD